MLRILGCFLILLLSSAPLQANDILSKLGKQPQFLPVDQAFKVDFAQQGNQLTLNWQIADGYYLYKDKFKIAGIAVNFSHPQYPPGLPHQDEYFGQTEVYRQQVEFTVPLANIDVDARLKVRYQGCAEAGLCYPVETVEIPLSQLTTTAVTADNAQRTKTAAAAEHSDTDTQTQAPISEQTELAERLNQDRSFWTLGLFFLLGLGLAFTPCVFPMYPILTSIIVGQGQKLSSTRAFTLSMAYVQGMAITYSLLGLVVASAGVQFQAYFQHPAVLIGISVLFVLLALAMFGVLQLQLPASWQEKVGQLSNQQQGGRVGSALLMGALSGLVASPCTTAPLTGVLLYIAQSGDLAYGALVLYVLSLGMGLPLLILGATGGKFLPKPGAWMDKIKALFGFLLLSVPLLLLERILPDQVLLVLLSLVLLAFALFLHQTQQQLQHPFWRSFTWLVATLIVAATLLLNQRFWWPTPAITVNQSAVASSDNIRNSKSLDDQNKQRATASVDQFADNNTQADLGKEQAATNANAFIDIKTLADLEQELAAAKAANQYVMLDLFAEWCVACKEFEHITFADAGVKTEMAKIRLLRIDVTKATAEDQQVLDKYNVLGLPTLLFFAPNGSELTKSRITGFMPPAQFQAHLAAINPN